MWFPKCCSSLLVQVWEETIRYITWVKDGPLTIARFVARPLSYCLLFARLLLPPFSRDGPVEGGDPGVWTRSLKGWKRRRQGEKMVMEETRWHQQLKTRK